MPTAHLHLPWVVLQSRPPTKSFLQFNKKHSGVRWFCPGCSSSPVVRDSTLSLPRPGFNPWSGHQDPTSCMAWPTTTEDLPAVLPIGLTLGWSPGGMAMVQHENATVCPNGGSMSHNIQSHTQTLTSTTVRQTATPNPASWSGSCSPFPLLCKH